MKKLLTLAALVGATTVSFAQGTVNFQNAASSLISANGAAMPTTSLFNFAVFLAPLDTANAGGQTAAFTDPKFQVVAATTVNQTGIAGRLVSRPGVDVGQPAGSTIDFIVRGWSANAGATWQEALLFWNNGQPVQDMWIGSSTIGNNAILGGGALPAPTLFGGAVYSVAGFNMPLVVAIPEPSSMVLAGLGAASLLLFRRRK